MKLPRFLIFSVLVVLVSSCVSGKKITYFQNIEDLRQTADAARSNLSIKPNDLLTISVSGPEPEAVLPFNLPVIGVSQGGALAVSGQSQLQSYLVDSEGKIQFPILGTVEVAGLNRQELAAKLKQQISDYVKNPIVNVRIVNFQVSVLGEVNRPGTFTIQDEYLSLPKALGLAGDMSIYGKRNNVLVMRETEGGIVKSAYIDLTDANVVNSPFYYLQQNDVVYVEPNGAQKQGAAYNRNASVYISIASVLISLAILITR